MNAVLLVEPRLSSKEKRVLVVVDALTRNGRAPTIMEVRHVMLKRERRLGIPALYDRLSRLRTKNMLRLEGKYSRTVHLTTWGRVALTAELPADE